MLIQDAIREFIDLRDLDNCSAKTIRTYEQRLRYFSQWLLNEHNVVEVNDLKVEHLRGWMAYLKKTPSYRGKAHSDDTIHKLWSVRGGLLSLVGAGRVCRSSGNEAFQTSTYGREG